jgi:uncharacterized membrane protein
MKHGVLESHLGQPAVRRVGRDRPAAWLYKGWQDIKANPLPSLAYGLLFGLCGDALLLASVTHPHLFTVAISGFVIVAPVLSAGLYELSRQREGGGKPGFIDSLPQLKKKAEPLAAFGLGVGLLAFFWERISAVMFGVLGGTSGIETTHFITQIVLSGNHRGFVAAWFIIGAILALLAFAVSVVSVPLMLDREVGPLTAVSTSLRAFSLNLETLVLWAALIVALTLLGFVTLLFGLILFMPLLGHASWHAYHDMVV